MTTISINIPNSITTRVVNAFAIKYGYQTTLANGDPNPQSKADFAREKLIELIKNAVRDVEIENAKNQAATLADAAVNSEIIIT